MPGCYKKDNVRSWLCSILYHEILKDFYYLSMVSQTISLMAPWKNGRDDEQPCLVNEGVELENDL